MNIEIVPVTQQNRAQACRLTVAPEQRGMVESVSQCLEEADMLALWRPVLLLVNGLPVAFAMYGLWEREGSHGRVWLDRFFIESHSQGKGYAHPLLNHMIAHIASSYAQKELFLSVYETNHRAIRIYQSLGFSFNGEEDIHGEKVMQLAL